MIYMINFAEMGFFGWLLKNLKLYSHSDFRHKSSAQTELIVSIHLFFFDLNIPGWISNVRIVLIAGYRSNYFASGHLMSRFKRKNSKADYQNLP